MFSALGITSFGLMMMLAFGIPMIVCVVAVLIALYLSREPEPDLDLDEWIPENMYPYQDDKNFDTCSASDFPTYHHRSDTL